MALGLLTIFIVSYFVRLADRIPVLGVLRIDLLLAFATLVAVIMQSSDDRFRLQFLTSKRILFFSAYILVSLPLVTWPGSVINNFSVWIKVTFFFLLVVGAVRSENLIGCFHQPGFDLVRR